MNMFVKTMGVALLASGMVMSGNAMAASKKPKAFDDACTVTGTDTSACDSLNVLDNDTNDATKVKPAVVVNTKYGKVKIAADGTVTFAMTGAAPKAGTKLTVGYKAWNKHGIDAGKLTITFKAAAQSDEN